MKSFSSEKSIFRSAVLVFKYLRGIFVLSGLLFFSTCVRYCLFLTLWGFSFRSFLMILLILHTNIHVFSHLSCISLRIPTCPFPDSFNHLVWSSSAWSSTFRTVFRCTKLLKNFPNKVNFGFGHLQELNNLWVCASLAMKLNNYLSFF